MKNKRIYKGLKGFTKFPYIYLKDPQSNSPYNSGVTLAGRGALRCQDCICSVSDYIDLHAHLPRPPQRWPSLKVIRAKIITVLGSPNFAFTVYQILTFYWYSNFLLRTGWALIQLVTRNTYSQTKLFPKTGCTPREPGYNQREHPWVDPPLTRPQAYALLEKKVVQFWHGSEAIPE